MEITGIKVLDNIINDYKEQLEISERKENNLKQLTKYIKKRKKTTEYKYMYTVDIYSTDTNYWFMDEANISVKSFNYYIVLRNKRTVLTINDNYNIEHNYQIDKCNYEICNKIIRHLPIERYKKVIELRSFNSKINYIKQCEKEDDLEQNRYIAIIDKKFKQMLEKNVEIQRIKKNNVQYKSLNNKEKNNLYNENTLKQMKFFDKRYKKK